MGALLCRLQLHRYLTMTYAVRLDSERLRICTAYLCRRCLHTLTLSETHHVPDHQTRNGTAHDGPGAI